MSDAKYIAFNNGIYNVVDDSFTDFNPAIVVTNKIPHDYNPQAYSELCDKTLNKLACRNADIRNLLEEMIGYTFYRRNELRKCFILTGEKRNGKSTFLDLINALLGEENISALDIKELNRQFKTAELVNKLANIGDDISDDFIPDGAIFKKLVSGNRVNVERKNSNPFDFNNYAKFLFSANNIPRMKDKTGAILDRMIIVPFNAEFKDTDEDYDPYIKYKLLAEDVMSYLINIGIKGLKRVLEVRKFTESKLVDLELKEYEENNNPVLTFFNEYGLDEILNNSTQAVYNKYKGYCYANGLQAISNIEFGKQLIKRYNLKQKYTKVDGKTVRVYVESEV
jgi:putative DNA primase/helicase